MPFIDGVGNPLNQNDDASKDECTLEETRFMDKATKAKQRMKQITITPRKKNHGGSNQRTGILRSRRTEENTESDSSMHHMQDAQSTTDATEDGRLTSGTALQDSAILQVRN